MTIAAAVLCTAAAVLSGARWLRVAQREHYLAGEVTRFAWRWWRSSAGNVGLAAVAWAAMVAAWWWPAAGVATAVAIGVGPIGLSLRGRTSPLAWTRRLRTLALVTAVIGAAAIAVGWWLGAGAPVAALMAVLVPLVVDVACGVTAPLERRLLEPHVARATSRLARLHPTTIAITGSYGKTSTKGYVAHLLGGRHNVVASPASYNNRAGLARAINEHLVEDTDVFVAEMGTYGPGEIAQLCAWIPPDIAVITAIGPVHLERFRTEERILAAKAEILAGASAIVLGVDDPRLAELAGRVEAEGRHVVRCSTSDAGAEIRALLRRDGTVAVFVDGDELDGAAPTHVRPGNLACAVGVARCMKVPSEEISARLATLPTVAHRLEPSLGSGGAMVLDDTYNANPAGARAALEQLRMAASPGGRAVLVTPGLVELGSRQRLENTRFAEAASSVATDLVVVGSTNRAALVAGAAGGSGTRGPGAKGAGANGPMPRIVTVATRDEAVAWVRDQAGPGDAVLYENDLPDHYP
jgi:UDP-N-acetylmuramoyl-tripeptide--D-alanyl-D-alanine ligase